MTRRPQPFAAFDFFVTFYDAGGPDLSLAVDVAKTFALAAFSEVGGLEAEVEIEEYREGGRNQGPLRFAKWGRYPALTFRRGVTLLPELWDWSYQVLHGNKAPIRKSGIVVLLDRGSEVPLIERMPAAVWHFTNGLPTRMRGPELNAKSNEIAIESLEISHEGLMRLGAAAVPGIGETLAGFGL